MEELHFVNFIDFEWIGPIGDGLNVRRNSVGEIVNEKHFTRNMKKLFSGQGSADLDVAAESGINGPDLG